MQPLFPNTIKRDLIIILCFALLITLPFLNKAVHVDDLYILAAKDHILKNPTDPYRFEFEFSQGRVAFHNHYSGSPFLPYYLTFTSLILGNSITLLHLSMIIFPLIGALSLYFLSRRYIKTPLWPPLLILSTPTFLTMSHNFMQDVPVAAFFILSITLFLYGLERESKLLLTYGAVAAGLAILLKYTALLLIPLLLILLFIERKPKKAIYFVIPIVILLCWLIPSYILYGKIHIIEILSAYKGNSLTSQFSLNTLITQYGARIISELSHFGGATLFPLLLTLPFLTSRKNQIAFLTTLVLPLPFLAFLQQFSHTFLSGPYTFGQLVLLEIFISSTLFFFYLITPFVPLSFAALKNNTSFLMIWFMAVYFANSLIVGGSARYNTLILAPLIILYCILVETTLTKEKGKTVLTLCFSLTLLLGLCVAVADYHYADSYRDFAQGTTQYKTPSNDVWFVGHQGFAYYMDEKGNTMLPSRSDLPQAGDYVITSKIPSPRPLSDDLLARMELVSSFVPHSLFLFRVEHPQSHAGFYTYGSGFLPYSFSTTPLETFEVYKVVR